MRIVAFAVASLAALASCASSPKTAQQARGLHLLSSWMAGTFTSEAQASTDPEHYFNVRLIMSPIWTDRTDGRWLYVEQAMATALDKPYRQRVYHVTAVGDGYQSAVFTMPGNALDYAGAWNDPAKLAALTPESLTQRDGCEIVLHWDESESAFRGGTQAASCPSDLRGAKYATSEVSVRANEIVSWDRGFDAQGNQVWGATMGGYQFVKVSQ